MIPPGVGEVRFHVLGPMEVHGGREVIDIGPRMVRAVLASLLIEANRPVTSDRLVDQLWGERPPPTAMSSLQVHVSALRRVLEPERRRGESPSVVVTQGAGYLLRVSPDEVDAMRFEAATLEASRLLAGGQPEPARERTDEALRLWRGQPYADLAFESFIQPEIARLEQLRSVALETAMEAELARGHHAAVLAELERLVGLHPLRERLRELFILALYRSGRQAEALRAYQDARRTLVEELGIEPRASLRQLEADILRHSPSLEWRPAATATEPEGDAVRAESYLEIDAGHGRRSMPLGAQRMTIGRTSSSSIPLADPAVSRLHAVIERYPGGWSIRDLGSANGTLINGEPLTAERQLRPGDEIRVGGVRLVFRSKESQSARPTVRWTERQG
jgi:DNA-binding SARP family transcriptional activator